jgi:hypothetical protein
MRYEWQSGGIVEIKLPSKNEFAALGWGRWLVILLAVLLMAAVIFSIIMHFIRQPVVVGGDFDPFSSEQEYTAFNKKHPVTYQEVPVGAHFHFKTSVSPGKQLVVQIYLLDLAVKADADGKSKAAYVAALEKFQQEARDWFKKQGEDLSKDYVQWLPNPASFRSTPTPTAHPPIGKSDQPASTPSPTPTPSGPQFPK